MTVEVSRQDIITDQIIEYKSENKFLKLPPVSYLEMLGISPLPSQMAMINAINNPKYRFLCAALSTPAWADHTTLLFSTKQPLPMVEMLLMLPFAPHLTEKALKPFSCQLPGDVTTGSRSFSIEATTVIFLNGAQYVLPIEITLGCPSQTSWRQESP